MLKQAERASKELGQNYTGTEHILLAMLREKDCAAAQLLIERKVEEEKVLELIRDLISPEGGAALAERDGFTPRAEKCWRTPARRRRASVKRRQARSIS